MLYARSMELYDDDTSKNKIISYKFEFDFEKARLQLETKIPLILNTIGTSTAEEFLVVLETNLIPILKSSRLKSHKRNRTKISRYAMDESGRLYKNYVNLRQGVYDENVLRNASESYQYARNQLNTSEFQILNDRYKEFMQSPDERSKLWKEIDWSGNYKDKKTSMIPIHCMADYFETLYQPLDRD